MNIPGAGAQVLRVSTSTEELSRRGVELVPGNRYVGRVLSVSNGRAIVNINGENILTNTSLPLREGQVLPFLADSADDGTLVLRPAEARPPVPRTPPSDAILPRTREHVANALRAAGVAPDDENMAAAEALLDRGLALSASNIDFVTRNARRFPGPAGEVTRALAQTRALGLPATDDIVAVLRVAARVPGSRSLPERLDEVARLARQLGNSLTALVSDETGSASGAHTALLHDIAEAISGLQQRAASVGPLGAELRQQLAAILAAARTATSPAEAVRSLQGLVALLSQAPLAEADEAGGAVNLVLAELALSLEGELARLGAFLTGAEAQPGLAARLSELMAGLQPALGTIPRTGPEAQVLQLTVDEARAFLQALRQALAASAQLSTARLPSGEAALAQLLEGFEAQLAGRIGAVASAITGEAPESLEAALTLLAQHARESLDHPHPHPALRVSHLADALAQVVESLSPELQEGSETIRGLAARLREIIGTLRGALPPEEQAPAAERAARDILATLGDYRAASQARITGLVTALASRAQRDAVIVTARITAALAQQVTQAAARADAMALPYAETSVVAGLRGDELTALQHAINQALTGIFSNFQEAGSALRDALGAFTLPLAESATTAAAGLASSPSPGTDQSLRLLAQLQPLLADPSVSALLPDRASQGARELAAALALESMQSAAMEAAQLSRLLSALPARLPAAAGSVQEDLEVAIELIGRSLENKLLSTEPARAVQEDLRAVLSRLQAALEHLVRTPAPAREGDAALIDQAQRLLATVTSARDALEGQQLLNAITPRTPAPHPIYVEVPLIVGDRRMDAKLKVFRDAAHSGEPIDPENARIALRLDTYSLGVVTALLEMKQGALSVDFSFDTEEARGRFASRREELIRALEASGLTVSWVDAAVKTPGRPDTFEALGEPMDEPYTISVLA